MRAKTNFAPITLTFSMIFFMAGCAGDGVTPPSMSSVNIQAREIATLSPDYWGEWGIDTSHINDNIRPGDDFYRYVNDGWLSTFKLPDDRTRYGAGSIAAEKARKQVEYIISDLAASKAPSNSKEGKISKFYRSYRDSAAIDAKGLNPAKKYLDQIAAIETAEGLAAIFGQPHFASPFDVGVFIDWKAPETNIMFTSIGGMQLSNRDQYLSLDEASRNIRSSYVELLAFLLTKIGHDDPQTAAADILKLETAIARADWVPTLKRNPDLTYNKLSWLEFQALMADFPIDAFAKSAGLEAADNVLVAEIPPTEAEMDRLNYSNAQIENLQRGYPAVIAIVNQTDLETWKAYLATHFLIDHAALLPSEIDDAVFAFFGTKLSGQTERSSREQRAAVAVNKAFGDAIGEIYVARHFPKKRKQYVLSMVNNITSAMEDSLNNVGWMEETTRAEALRKLATLNLKIGYPETFKNYDGVTISNDALDNAVAIKQFSWAENPARLGQPVDRNIWFYPPQRVGAYYATAFNEIVFPAAILQPPFFNASADAAVNYGSIGGIIGHEISHAFDDEGARYDAKGMLRNWWSEGDQKAFQAVGERLAEQFDRYCPFDNGATCVNGQLTLGENLADLGGVALAYRAYRKSLNGKEAPVLDGYTGDQRFFMAWAQVYRFKVREEITRKQLSRDPHSPAEYRVNGIVRNLDAWYEAFGVQDTDSLYIPPEDRVRPW
ncbi:M13 family metallopeptidase [Parasphingorhabdus cellanae]|uniref:M13 family metallopeptidase n=1 Tax=Parasphingorhabdus cellanae TaxID=2806553 RepID=A0ABX7T1A3_9SPHN|nr:M13 family metallopeptidase [Parasphingorhabdus cellanae]QTD55336.1 M13 family metallopeptidase [Parasphingorhabdus cellanae]